MCKWQCPACLAWVSSAYLRNLQLLVDEHRGALCLYKDTPPEARPLTAKDAKFLEELKVGW